MRYYVANKNMNITAICIVLMRYCVANKNMNITVYLFGKIKVMFFVQDEKNK